MKDVCQPFDRTNNKMDRSLGKFGIINRAYGLLGASLSYTPSELRLTSAIRQKRKIRASLVDTGKALNRRLTNTSLKLDKNKDTIGDF
jgi:hypothetical protein